MSSPLSRSFQALADRVVTEYRAALPVRRRIAKLGSRRVELADGSWYWDLKLDWRPGEVVDL